MPVLSFKMEKEKLKPKRHRPRKNRSCVANLNVITALENEGCNFDISCNSKYVFDIRNFQHEIESDSDLDEEFQNLKLDWQPFNMEVFRGQNECIVSCQTSESPMVAKFESECVLVNKQDRSLRHWCFDWTRGGMALLPPELIHPPSFFKKEGEEMKAVVDWTDEERW